MAKTTMTVFSKRIRKTNLSEETVVNLQSIFEVQNKAKIKAYSVLAYKDEKAFLKKEGFNSLHLYIKNKFKLNTYFANFSVREAKWVISSNKELQKYHIKNKEERITHKKDYIKKQEKKLAYWTKIKEYMISVSKDLKAGKTSKMKNFRPYSFFIGDGNILVDANYKDKEIIYSFYLFEVNVVNRKISTLKNKINNLKHGLQIEEIKLTKLKENPKRSCFGGKNLFKAQFTTYKEDLSLWKEEFNKSRNKIIQLQGCTTATQGNFCVRYDISNKSLKIQLPWEIQRDKENKVINNFFEIENVEFTYNNHLYLEALNKKGSVISYRLEDYGHYYLIKATFDIEKEDKYINYSKGDGVIGYDVNYNHIAWSELDKFGNLISFGNIPFSIKGKTFNQANKLLEGIAIKLVNIAKTKNKPLVGEDLNKITNNKSSYGNSKRNRHISLFAYRKIITSIKSRAFKESIDVSYVNPAYTSSTGKLKYMKAKGLSIHTSASYVIGRRGMNYKEKLKSYSKFNLDWKKLNKEFKTIWIHWFYKTPNINDFINIKDYVNEIKEINKTKIIKNRPLSYVI